MNAYYFYLSQRLLIWLGLSNLYKFAIMRNVWSCLVRSLAIFLRWIQTRIYISWKPRIYIYITFRLFCAVHLNLLCLYDNVRKLQLNIQTKICPYCQNLNNNNSLELFISYWWYWLFIHGISREHMYIRYIVLIINV